MMNDFRLSCGIIIKDERATRRTMILLDRHLGKIQVVLSPRIVGNAPLHAALVEYELLGQRDYQVRRMQLLLTPPRMHITDLAYAHHLMELAHLFLPMGAPAPEIYEHLVEYLQIAEQFNLYSCLSKLAVARLLYLSGWYEPGATMIDDLVQLPMMQLITEDLREADEAVLDALIADCLQRHPYAHTLKTIRFLKG